MAAREGCIPSRANTTSIAHNLEYYQSQNMHNNHTYKRVQDEEERERKTAEPSQAKELSYLLTILGTYIAQSEKVNRCNLGSVTHSSLSQHHIAYCPKEFPVSAIWPPQL